MQKKTSASHPLPLDHVFTDQDTAGFIEYGRRIAQARPKPGKAHTQTQRIIEYLLHNNGITQKEAMNDLGIYRLASRIHDIKKMGINIISKTITVKNRFGENCFIGQYHLADYFDFGEGL